MAGTEQQNGTRATARPELVFRIGVTGNRNFTDDQFRELRPKIEHLFEIVQSELNAVSLIRGRVDMSNNEPSSPYYQTDTGDVPYHIRRIIFV